RSTSAGSPSSRRPTWTPRWGGPGRCPRPPRCRSRCGRSRATGADLLATDVDAARIAGVFRAAYGRAVAVLAGVLGDRHLGVDAAKAACAEATRRWPG